MSEFAKDYHSTDIELDLSASTDASDILAQHDQMRHNTQDSAQNGGKLELLEERAEVVKDKIVAGKVVIQKQIRMHTVNVPVELQEEFLIVRYVADPASAQFLTGDYEQKDVIAHFDETISAQVTLNGEPLALGQETELVLSRQIAVVTKKTHAIEEVAIETFTETKTHSLTTELRREELVVDGEEYITPMV